jgi:hypothetical protein
MDSRNRYVSHKQVCARLVNTNDTPKTTRQTALMICWSNKLALPHAVASTTIAALIAGV